MTLTAVAVGACSGGALSKSKGGRDYQQPKDNAHRRHGHCLHPAYENSGRVLPLVGSIAF